MALYVPVVCKFLSQQRQLRRREKSEVDPLFDAVRALRNAEIVRERSLSWSADKRASSAAEITRMDDEIARLSGVLSADVLGHDREQMALSMTLGRYAGPSEVAARRACIEAVILPVQF